MGGEVIIAIVVIALIVLALFCIFSKNLQVRALGYLIFGILFLYFGIVNLITAYNVYKVSTQI